MVVWFIDGSKIIHSVNAKVCISKAKNELYVFDDREYIYRLDVVKQVDL